MSDPELSGMFESIRARAQAFQDLVKTLFTPPETVQPAETTPATEAASESAVMVDRATKGGKKKVKWVYAHVVKL